MRLVRSSPLLHPKPEIIAHRGASFDAPENTWPAIDLGWRQGAEAVEVDVRVTADGEVIVFHDPRLGRITSSPQRVDQARWRDVQRLDAGMFKGDSWRGTRIPRLSSILVRIPRGRQLWVELKPGPKILSRLALVLEKHPARSGRLVLIGFSYRLMCQARRRFPRVDVLLNVAFTRRGNRWRPTAADILRRVRAAGLHGAHLEARPGVAAIVRRLRAQKLPVYCWTVDDPPIARTLIEAGVSGITTNRPGRLRAALAL